MIGGFSELEVGLSGPLLGFIGLFGGSGEFGFFLEDQNSKRREYTLWIDSEGAMHLRVREDEEIIGDDVVSVLDVEKLQRDGNSPYSYYYKFPIQIFLEFDNWGLDILYLQEGPYRDVHASEIQPGQMTRIDSSIRPSFKNLQMVGLVGNGYETEVLIWPLTFFRK